MNKNVSIIIVNWNGKKYLEKCIKSLLAQSYKDFEIILVDNASTDDSLELVRHKFPMVRIIQNKTNVGFAEGNNIGIEKSDGKLVALVNPDAFVDVDWLLTLVEVLEGFSGIAAVTGKIYYFGDKYGKDAVFCTWPKINCYSATPYNFHDNEPKSKVDYLSGAAMLVRREVIERIGKMDTGYFLFFEETDWCARMIRAGYDLVYIPEAKAWHVVSASVSDSQKKTYFLERNRIRFAIKNFDLDHLLVFYFYLFTETAFVLLRDIKNGNFTRAKIRLRAIVWNIFNIKKTILQRNMDTCILKNNGEIRSYNKSLPLLSFKGK